MALSDIVIPAKLRSATTKGTNRRLRLSGAVPAVLYRKQGNLNLEISLRQLPQGHTGARIITLDLGSEKISALMREVQVNRLTGTPIHLDFQEVAPNSVVVTRVPLAFEGLTREQEKEGSFRVLTRSINVKGEAAKLPEVIKVNVSHLKANDVIYLKDITLPEGVVAKGSPSMPLAQLARK